MHYPRQKSPTAVSHDLSISDQVFSPSRGCILPTIRVCPLHYTSTIVPGASIQTSDRFVVPDGSSGHQAVKKENFQKIISFQGYSGQVNTHCSSPYDLFESMTSLLHKRETWCLVQRVPMVEHHRCVTKNSGMKDSTARHNVFMLNHL